MPFPFSEICTLLGRLEDIELSDVIVLKPGEKSAQAKAVIESWFKSHRRAINELDISNAVALLSALLPERRVDRVYGIQAPRLCRILSRYLNLGASRVKDLQVYKEPGRGDFATCLERVLAAGGPPALHPVDLEEVDEMFNVLAECSQFSDAAFRLPPGSSEARDELLGRIFKRLQPSQGKWLARLILKDLSPVRIDEGLILYSFHFLLPDLLRFQDRFRAAVSLLKGPLKEYPSHPDPRSQRLHRQNAAEHLIPAIGVKIGKPKFHKARGIDSCISMLGGQPWVLERKYDGEYCEIHISVDKSKDPLQWVSIFSKSGKRSTKDRAALHQTVAECLHLGQPECKITRQAILLGEMVVYSDEERRVMSFDKIRKHVQRSGRFLGTDEDSPPNPCEHLAIVFFDILLLDDEIVMRRPVTERRMWLRIVYTKIQGRAIAAEWKIVDFSDRERAKRILIEQFAASIAQRCEGLILKPCSTPYFSIHREGTGHINDYIKLKKDYIDGMGDEADFAVIGSSYNGQHALASGVRSLRWTEFHLGCLLNKHEVIRFDARPRYKVVHSIKAGEQCIPKPVLEAANVIGRFCAKPYSPSTPPNNFDLDIGTTGRIETVFDEPFVFEVLGSGFEKPPNCNFLMLRHPRVKKLHEDRSWRDCVSLSELQEQAHAARNAPPDSESQETMKLVARLEKKCRKKAERQSTVTPQSRVTNGSTPLAPPSTLRPLPAIQRTKDGITSSPTLNNAQLSSASTNAIDGTTLIDEITAFRPNKTRRVKQAETPCPEAKKRRTDERFESHIVEDATTATRQNSAPHKAPLSEIINEAYSISSSKSHTPSRRSQIRDYDTKRKALEKANHTIDRTPRQVKGEETTLYLAPSLHGLVLHYMLHTNPNITLISNLSHWDRDAFAYSPLAEVVSESPAHQGTRKVVLVDATSVRETENVIREVKGLNGGVWREREVEIVDWRDFLGRAQGMG